MKVIVLGCGNIGSIIAQDLAENLNGAEITVSLRDKERAKAAASRIEGANWTTINAKDYPKLVEVVGEFDLIIGALPSEYGYQSMRAAAEAGVNMVDISTPSEDPLQLDNMAKEAGITIIPDCGVAPGLTNMLVGYSASRLDVMRKAYIMTGSIPEHPLPPMGWELSTFWERWVSKAEAVIEFYLMDVSIVDGGRIVHVPTLSGLEELDFPGVGKLEAFYTGGLRTMIGSYPGVSSMWEKTLRYPGNVEGIKLLRELGFFDEKTVMVGDMQVSPRTVSARILERSLKKPIVEDILAMRVEVIGEKGGREVRMSYHLLDRFDRVKGVSAMARMTGYPAAVAARKLAQGEIKEKGVVPPERIGEKETLFKSLLSDLRRKGVKVEETYL